MKKRVTMQDIANETGLSSAAVSYVLNGNVITSYSIHYTKLYEDRWARMAARPSMGNAGNCSGICVERYWVLRIDTARRAERNKQILL